MHKLCIYIYKKNDDFQNRTIPMGKCLFLWVDVRLMNYVQSERSLKLLKRLVINKCGFLLLFFLKIKEKQN